MTDVIGHVSDTALWVAYYRAVESERPDALFRDPWAKSLVGDRGKAIAAHMGSTARYTQWTVVVRTVLIDRYIDALIGEGIDTVLNLGAGLDARPYRMDLPASLRWIEVDHADLIDHKERILAAEKPRCRLERVPLDLADREKRRAFLTDVERRSQKALVLTEGVLPYLTEAQVAELAQDLRAFASLRFWIAEYMAKEVYPYLKTRAQARKMRNAPFQFFPDDWLGFFRRHGWAPREIKYTGEEGGKLGRGFPLPWWAFLFRLFASQERRRQVLRMTGFALFERGPSREDPKA